MGVISPAIVVTGADRHRKAKVVEQDNRKWVTVIQGINTDGWVLPPFIVVKGSFYLGNWYSEDSFLPSWTIKQTANG